MPETVYTPADPMPAAATYVFPFFLLSQADPKIAKASPTLAAGDFILFTKTAGTWSRIGNLSTTPTLIGVSTIALQMTILNTEIPAGTQAMMVVCHDVAGAEWCDLAIVKSIDTAKSIGTSDLTLANITGSALFTGITSLANWLRGLARKDAMDAAAKLELNAGGGTYSELTDSLEAERDNIGTGGASLSSLPNVTVGNLIQSALAKFANTDTGEVAAVAGSVAKLSQGTPPATVTVGALTVPALAQFANTNTLEVAAVPGSVADLSQGSACTFPAGAITFTYTVVDPGALPVGNITVWISTDNPPSGNPLNIIWSGITDAFGIARDNQGNKPMLNPGNYFFWTAGPGYTPAAWPDPETVS